TLSRSISMIAAWYTSRSIAACRHHLEDPVRNFSKSGGRAWKHVPHFGNRNDDWLWSGIPYRGLPSGESAPGYRRAVICPSSVASSLVLPSRSRDAHVLRLAARSLVPRSPFPRFRSSVRPSPSPGPRRSAFAPCDARSRALGARFDEGGAGQNASFAPDLVVQELPEGHAEFATGLLEAGKRVASATAIFAAGAATDLA